MIATPVAASVQLFDNDDNPHKLPDGGLRSLAFTDAAALTIARLAYLRWRASFVMLSEMHGTQPNSPLPRSGIVKAKSATVTARSAIALIASDQ